MYRTLKFVLIYYKHLNMLNNFIVVNRFIKHQYELLNEVCDWVIPKNLEKYLENN